MPAMVESGHERDRLGFTSLAFRKQAGQVALPLFRHFYQRFRCAGIVDVSGKSTTTVDALAHVVEGIIAHDPQTVVAHRRSQGLGKLHCVSVKAATARAPRGSNGSIAAAT